MTHTSGYQEQVYECQECGSLHCGTEIASRPISKALYCDQCQSERVRLCEDYGSEGVGGHFGGGIVPDCQNGR